MLPILLCNCRGLLLFATLVVLLNSQSLTRGAGRPKDNITIPAIDSERQVALRFHGQNDYVEIPDDPLLSAIGSHFTLECWIRINTLPLTNQEVMGKWGCGSNEDDEFGRDIHPDGRILATVSGLATWYYLLSDPIPVKTWTHVASVFDATTHTHELYINGVLNQSQETAPSFVMDRDTDQPFRIGTYDLCFFPSFNGDIDEVRIWNTSRTEEEIQSSMSISLNGNEAGLLGYWRIDEGRGTIAHDATPNGIHGTLINGPAWLGQRPPQSEPYVASVIDIPGDQGGYVTLKWEASSLDTNVNVLQHYSIWRALPGQSSAASSSSNDIHRNYSAASFRIVKFHDQAYAWEWIGNEPAHRFPAYSFTAPTLYDQTQTIDGKHYFLVSAQTGDPNVFYDSNVDSGYSVDNLAPASPQQLAGSYSSPSVMLRWNANSEPDLRQYILYRSDHPNINPSSIPSVAVTVDTSYVDSDPLPGGVFYYLVIAQDIHGNQGPGSNELRIVATGIFERTGELPAENALYQNYPNPFNPKTNVAFDVARDGFVTVKVFNALGEEIITLVNNRLSAGRYDVTFDATEFMSGVYYYRMTVSADGTTFSRTKKLVLLQ